MKNLTILLLLLFFCDLLSSENSLIIHSYHKEKTIPIDSIWIKNLSNDKELRLTNFSQEYPFTIDLIKGSIETSISSVEMSQFISVFENIPGKLSLFNSGYENSTLDISVTDVLGRNVFNSTVSQSKQLIISIPKSEIYIISVSNEFMRQSFKVLGAEDFHSFQIDEGNDHRHLQKKSLIVNFEGDEFCSLGDTIELIGYKKDFFQVNKTIEFLGSSDIALSFEPSVLKDIEGNKYNAVKLGTQIWMAENLKVTRYPDNTKIPLVTKDNAWANLENSYTADAYCFYNNNLNGEKEKYGALYTFAAAIADNWQHDKKENQGICPDGWHLPSDEEWIELEIYLGMTPQLANDLNERVGAGGKLKYTDGWAADGNGTNESGFSVKPGGIRRDDYGDFINEGYAQYYWTRSSSNLSENIYFRGFSYEEDIDRYSSHKISRGFGVRCLKDTVIEISPSISTGEAYAVGDTHATFGATINYNGGTSILDWGIEICPNNNFNSDSVLVFPGWMRNDYNVIVNAEELEPNAMYYFRAYIINKLGPSFGDTLSFNTKQLNYFSSISDDSLIFSSSGDANWFVMDTDMGTYGNAGKARSGIIDEGQVSSVTTHINGSGVINFRWWIDGYYTYSPDSLRFYVDNELVKTFDFGDWNSQYKYTMLDTGIHAYTWKFEKNTSLFKTPDAGRLHDVEFTPVTYSTPVIETMNPYYVKSDKCSLIGRILENGNTPVLEKGVVYSTEKNFNPSEAHRVTHSNTGVGKFSVTIDSLVANTKYYYSAYAINAKGIAYGEVLNFTTLESNTVSDYEGNIYKLVKIGDQTWTAENLKSTQYSDGAKLSLTASGLDWFNLRLTDTIMAYCYYNNNVNTEKDIYGALYTHLAATRGENNEKVQGICPAGWHLPNDAEWEQLLSYMSSNGDSIYSADYLKYELGWKNNGQNRYGFDALPAGYRDYYTEFFKAGTETFWWSASMGNNSIYRSSYSINNFRPTVKHNTNTPNTNGISVRCIKDGN